MMRIPTQTLAIYGGLVTLVYLATDGFNNSAPFVFTIPVVMLGVITCGTHMPQRKKMFTALSFFTLAAALYHWSVFPKRLELSAAMVGVAHLIYLLSFVCSLRRVWTGLAVATALVVVTFMYSVFADLFRSVPTLIATLGLTITVLSLSFIVAGSVWKNGSTIAYEERTAFIRFMGMFFMMICDAALIIDQFGNHTRTLVWYLNFTYYISQFLLYFANERAF